MAYYLCSCQCFYCQMRPHSWCAIHTIWLGRQLSRFARRDYAAPASCRLALVFTVPSPLRSSAGPNIAAGCSQSSSASLDFTFGSGDAGGAVMNRRPFLRLPRSTSRTPRHLVRPLVWCRQVTWCVVRSLAWWHQVTVLLCLFNAFVLSMHWVSFKSWTMFTSLARVGHGFF